MRREPGCWCAQRRGARHYSRAGTALLEAMVALTILTIAGGAAVALASQTTAAVDQARIRDAEMRRASAFLDAVTLWPREDLDRHLGDRREGSWVLRVDRPYPTLYAVALNTAPDSAHGRPLMRALLRTIIYRPEPPG